MKSSQLGSESDIVDIRRSRRRVDGVDLKKEKKKEGKKARRRASSVIDGDTSEQDKLIDGVQRRDLSGINVNACAK